MDRVVEEGGRGRGGEEGREGKERRGEGGGREKGREGGWGNEGGEMVPVTEKAKELTQTET